MNINLAGLAWLGDALCAEIGGELFFLEQGESSRAAKQVCKACPVRAECLEYALAHDEMPGIFGGMSPQERRAIRRQRAAAAELGRAA